MFVTGDATEYRAFTKGCESCARLADRVEGWHAAGGWIKTTPWRFTTLRVVGGPDSAPIFEAGIVLDPTRYRESSNGPIKKFKGGRSLLKAYPVKSDGRWVLSYYVQVAQ